MTAISEEVAQLLEAEGIGTIGTDIFYTVWGPDSTDAQTVIFGRGGSASDAPEVYEQPNIEIIVRGDKDADGLTVYALAEQIYRFLISYGGTDNSLLEFNPQTTINDLGRDDNARPQFEMIFFTFRNP